MALTKITAGVPVALISNPQATEFAILLGDGVDDYDFIMPIVAKDLLEAQTMAEEIVPQLLAWVARIMKSAVAEDLEDDSDDRPIPGAGYVH